jgi:8-oxo-dGTP pyrophosphatase MutT (NUDIX family)
MFELPDDLPVVERDVVRMVVLDVHAHALLFHTRDPTCPELGEWWELPGGGIEKGEDAVDSAIRELREEAGTMATPAQVGAPAWRRDATFRYRGMRHLQHERVLTVRLEVPGPSVNGSQRVGFEDEDYFGFRWWPIDDIVDNGNRFYPESAGDPAPPAASGEEIQEPFEVWS